MAYMIAYIRFQAEVKDFKEMSGALVALLFAWVQFARTVVGLWQLHVFRHCAAASFETLSHLATLRRKKNRGLRIGTESGSSG